MKNWLPPLLFLPLLLFPTFSTFGQTKADVMTCFNQVLALPEVTEMVEQKQLKSPALIIRKMENRPFYPTEGEKVFFELETLDFQDVPEPANVRFLSKREMEKEGILTDDALNLRFRFSEGRIILFLSTFVEESRRLFKGYFAFEEKAGKWELENKQISFL